MKIASAYMLLSSMKDSRWLDLSKSNSLLSDKGPMGS